jgi:site-specific recombinase XerD
MALEEQITSFEKYWRRRKPTSSTAVHYASDVRIFFQWAQRTAPEAITVHHIDEFIEWQQESDRASATIQRRLVALHAFYDFLAYMQDQEVANPVVPQRHYIDLGHHLPRNLHESEIEKLFLTIGDHLRDRTIFTLMLHAGLRVGRSSTWSWGIFTFQNQVPLTCDLRGKAIVSELFIYLQPPHNSSANISPHDPMRATSISF